jgi:nucleoside-diphosphate-sugar epimerase
MVLNKIAQETGLEVVILRPPLVYGPGVKANFLQLIQTINRGIPLPLARIKNHRSMIFLGNLVDAILICIIDPRAAGKTFLLSDGKDVSIAELIQMISSALGRPSRLFPLPPELLRFLAKLTRRSNAVSRLLDSLIVDCSRIRTELDWAPPYSMKEGLEETANWYLQTFK